jgi:hypothetical protein
MFHRPILFIARSQIFSLAAGIYISLLVAVCIACNSPDIKDTSDEAPFPRMDYLTAKIISVDRDKVEDGILKRMRYLEGQGASGIIDSTGSPVTNKIKLISLTHSQIDSLSRILRPRPMKESEQWTDGDCTPQYRDAIVFFGENDKPVAWINICFTCERTMFVPRSEYMYGFDLDQHLELRSYFKTLGYVPEGRP